MMGRLRYLLLLAGVLVAGYLGMLTILPDRRPSAGASPSATGQSELRRYGADVEIVVCDLTIPSAAECGPLEGCPATQVEHILGVTLANPVGIVIATVDPDGPAAQAGVQPGGRLAGGSQCPSAMLGVFLPGSEERTVKLHVKRLKLNAADTTADDDAERPTHQEARD